jgi:competence transcription factor ComK
VLPPIIIKVNKKVYFLPTMSPNLPKNKAPNGRTINPAAKVANVAKNAVVGLVDGKNFSEIIVAKLPKM